MTRRMKPGDSTAGHRVRIVLSCSKCGARNYKTTRAPRETAALELKKFCKTCNAHTVHTESK